MISKRVSELLCSTARYPLAREYDIKIPGAVNLASNENPYGPSPAVLRALKRELKLSGLYPDPRATKLKQAIGGYLGVGTDCIAIGNGSDELMDLVCKAFVDQGDRVLIPLPTFAMYELSCVPYGGKPVFYKLPNFEWCTDELARAAKNTKLVFLGRPNNPTGNCLSLDGLRELLKVGAIIVVDEAYVEFAVDSVAKLAAKRKNLIVLRTLSKAFGLAGLRVGYAVGNPETIKILERLRAPFNVNRLAQVAAVAALRDQRYMRRVVAGIKNGRAYIRRELAKLGFKVLPSDANFLMVDVSPLEIDAPGLCDFLVKRKIFVRDLSDFRGAGPNYVRVTVGTPQQNERLVGALKKLKGGR